ncbi:MAG TPA: TetR/AcrR family transcriptional regulator [Bacteroidales bacterium]|nr:TetR/AcrR family transcriptional regulator [Bacteroidales bacterium]
MNEELSVILKRVLALYRKYGIKSITMDDVSRELGISKKTLYQYVKDKDELVSKVVELEISSHQSHLMQSCSENLNAIEQIAEISRCVSFMLREYSAVAEFDLRKYYPDLHKRLREVRRENMLRFIHDNLVRGKNEGLYRSDLNAEVVAKIAQSHLDSMFESEIITVAEFLEPAFSMEFFNYHLRGIVSEKGLKVLDDELKSFGRQNK